VYVRRVYRAPVFTGRVHRVVCTNLKTENPYRIDSCVLLTSISKSPFVYTSFVVGTRSLSTDIALRLDKE